MAGLAALGHDVYYHEDTWCWPYHPLQKSYVDDPEYSVAYLARFFADFAPTLLALMGLPQPPEMTGRSLLR